MKRSADAVVPSLARACEALHLLAGRSEGLTAAEFSRRTRLSRATAFRVLKTLCAVGMAEQNDMLYQPGPRLLQLGAQVLDGHGLRVAAVPILRRLADEVGHTAHLAVRSSDFSLILEVCDSPNLLRVASRPGTSVRLHCSATGKAMLATMSDGEARVTMARTGYERLTGRTIANWRELRTELHRIRRRGYAVDDREYHDDVRCAAAALGRSGEPATAAIGITGPASVLTIARLPSAGEAVAAAAQALSNRMGGNTAGTGEPA
jgi:DNA-binding IclR family transcriptional regulator